jgi:hypothetical protein
MPIPDPPFGAGYVWSAAGLGSDTSVPPPPSTAAPNASSPDPQIVRE